MVTDHARRELFGALEAALGAAPAATMMELLPPVGWSDVARQSDLVAIRGEIAEVRGEIAELRGEVRAQLPRLITANIASMIGVAGLVLAAAHL